MTTEKHLISSSNIFVKVECTFPNKNVYFVHPSYAVISVHAEYECTYTLPPVVLVIIIIAFDFE